MQSGAWTENWQQTSKERDGLRYRWIRWPSLFQQAESVWGGTVPPEPCKRTQLVLEFMRFSLSNSGAVREGRWRQQHSLAQVQNRKSKASLHALCQRPLSLQQEQTPAQIAFNIQTLLNVQFISSSMETFFFWKNCFYSFYHFQLKSMKT